MGIFSILLIFGMVFVACEQPGNGDSDDNNTTNTNTGNNTPTTGTLIITNTSPDWYIRSVEVYESGGTTIIDNYNGSPLGKDKSCTFSLSTGVYDITLKDDYPSTIYKRNVVVTAGKTVNLTFNGGEIL